MAESSWSVTSIIVQRQAIFSVKSFYSSSDDHCPDYKFNEQVLIFVFFFFAGGGGDASYALAFVHLRVPHPGYKTSCRLKDRFFQDFAK